jgi:predicted transposase YbfD/YdcC
MDVLKAKNFQPFLSIHDPRLERKKLHKLFDILVITICAVLCGVDDWEHIAEFGRSNEDWFRGFLELPNGIPSHDTFGRVFSLLDPKEFEKSFIEWMKLLYEVSQGEIIAIDGKSLAGTYQKDLNKVAVHMVSAFATRNGVVLGQVKTEAKSNEITAIPKLLELLNLEGCIVTIDAAGCQKKIVAQIIDQKADYVLSLKGNQANLHEDVKLYLDTESTKEEVKQTDHDCYETTEKDHGRIDIRRYWITENIDWLYQKDDWKGLKSIGFVESERIIGDKTTKERRYFICSIEANAKKFCRAVREHWHVENKLHWVLDVTFNEDGNQTRNDRAAQNLSMMRRLALNAVKQDKSKGSLKTKMLRAGWNKKFLIGLLGKLFKL